MSSETVRATGPLFDGRADAALREGVEHVRHEVSARGQKLVTAAFMAAIRENHGHAISRITTTSRTALYTSRGDNGKTYSMPILVGQDEDIVTTDLATYGPWLEGTGSRNFTTRFKGYHGYRRSAQELNMIADIVAEDAIRPYVARMQ